MEFEALIRRCIDRDPEAWSKLVENHRPLVLRVLVKIVGNADVATLQDLEQEAYERLLINDFAVLRAAEDGSHLKGILCRTAANLARDHRRRVNVRRRFGGEPTTDEDGEDQLGGLPSPSFLPEEGAHRRLSVERALSALDDVVSGAQAERDRLIFRAYYVDDMTAPEIAALGVGLSVKGVETVLYRLTQKIRERVLSKEDPAA